MGLGEYLSSDVRAKQWVVEEERERREVREMPEAEEEEIYSIFSEYGVSRSGAKGVVEQLKANEDQWVAVSSESPSLYEIWVKSANDENSS
jgi:hypothetical protein